jgi:hypothetical protein
MTYPKGKYAEFLPRFEIAYRRAHQQFREDIESGAAFAVTQNEILDAQVFVEAAHRSAQDAGARYSLKRYDDWQEYRAACMNNGLIDNDLVSQ